MKKSFIIGIIVICAVLVVYFVSKTFTASDEAGNPSFQTEKLQKGNFEITVSSTGRLAAISTVKVGIQVSGTIEKVLVDFNQQVKKGDILAILDKSILETDVEQAAASVQKAEAEAASARQEYDRNKRLSAQGVVSERDMQLSVTSMKTSKAILQQATANLKKMQTNLNNAVIKAPISGTIIEKNIDAGQTLAASFSTPTLFVIAEDLSHMQIEANVDETDIGQIKETQNVRFTVQAYPDNVFTGRVRQVRLNSQVISNVVNYTVVITAENKNGLLLPGMTATVDFIVAFQPDVLLVPNGALAFTPNDQILLKIKKEWERQATAEDLKNKGIFYYQDTTGAARIAAVNKGLSNGIVTVVDPNPDVYPGMPVITGYVKSTIGNKKKSLLGKLIPGRSSRP
ncbi:MAG: efflux RND transporter periplasmic adaptor subunit [bacterium]